MRFAARYDNGSGYMELARYASTYEEAMVEALKSPWAGVDIVRVNDDNTETVLASAPIGQGWTITEEWKEANKCGFCGNLNMEENGTPNWATDMGWQACNDPCCGGI